MGLTDSKDISLSFEFMQRIDINHCYKKNYKRVLAGILVGKQFCLSIVIFF